MNNLINIWLLLAIGIILGHERKSHNNVIGIRTITLVLLGSFIFTYISTQIGGDPARIIAQVVSGTGFIGAGLILKKDENVHNLTTAVLIWCLSGMGCLIALDFCTEAIILTVIIYIVLKYYKHFFDYGDY